MNQELYNMLVIIGNWGNETIALLKWALKKKPTEALYLLTVETGYAAPQWSERTVLGASFASQNGINHFILKPRLTFQELVKHRGEFPSPSFLWCADSLKKVPILEWLEKHDPHHSATILLPYRQHVSISPFDFTAASEQYDDRKVECPLLLFTEQECQKLVSEAGFVWLSHNSLECAPCVNLSVKALALTSADSINKLADLEKCVGKTLCKNKEGRPIGVHEYLTLNQEEVSVLSGFTLSCADYFGCGR